MTNTADFRIDAKLTSAAKLYLVCNTVVLASVGLLVLLTPMTMGSSVAVTSWVLTSLAIQGLLIDGSSLALRLEVIRCLFAICVLSFVRQATEPFQAFGEHTTTARMAVQLSIFSLLCYGFVNHGSRLLGQPLEKRWD